ncbi:MAG: 4-hydroxy-tetrahydrodipicolinate synthase, partial [Bacteroidia bacterium]|nr:4-hydroxy-tetrahydrodipicolinate synthase [Bacteroidia bacterium]
MYSANIFRGTGVAIVTPFKANGQVDFKSLIRIINHIIKGKVEYIVALGTTGESVTLTKEEKIDVVNCIIDTAKKRVPVVLGLGGNDTREIVTGFNSFDFKNIAAVLSVSPAYNKPSQQGIFEHYKVVAKESPRPVILYNVPGRTASNITSDTTLRIANEIKNVIGIKEASGNVEQCMRIIKNKPKDFFVVSGDDAITLPLIACGADGVISVVANAFPKFSEMVRQALKGNFNKARELNYKHTEIIEQLFADGNPGGVKEFLAVLGLCDPYFRLPLVRVNKQVQDKI